MICPAHHRRRAPPGCGAPPRRSASPTALHAQPSWSPYTLRPMVDHYVTEVQAAITASATYGHAEGHRRPRTPLASGAAVLWSRPEAPGIAEAMLEACMASRLWMRHGRGRS